MRIAAVVLCVAMLASCMQWTHTETFHGVSGDRIEEHDGRCPDPPQMSVDCTEHKHASAAGIVVAVLALALLGIIEIALRAPA